MKSRLTVPRNPLLVPSSAIGPTKRGLESVDWKALGLVPGIGGGAQGYNTEGDVLSQTIDGRNLNDIWRDFQQSLALHNQFRQRIMDLLSYSVQSPIEDVPNPSADDFEEASEFGEPKGIRTGDYFSVGFDFKWYDVAIRYTWKYLAESTAAQVEALNNIALEADNRLLFNKVLKRIFDNVNGATDIRGTNYTVYPFYNNDGTVPPNFKNYTHTGTHTHYLASGAATVDSGDLDEMATHLRHHGYSRELGARLILMVNSAQLATIRTFRVATGSAYDFVPAQGSPPFLLPTNTGGIQGGQPASELDGLIVAGVYGPWTIIEEDYIPAGYMLGFATGGILAATNPVGIREHQNASLRGLRLVKGRENDYPLIDSFYQRGFGTGVRHRGAGVVMKITTGAYTIPTEYA